jgi:predicted phosphodiesterase
VFVRGNHDAPSLQQEIAQIPRAYVLDGRSVTLNGISIYGLGHPNFLTDRAQNLDLNAFAAEARSVGPRILADVQAMERPPDIVAVHDDRMAEAVAGYVPLVVSGHFHENGAKVVDGTLFLRLGTTGGAGPVTFTPEGGVPLSAEVLYFAPGDTFHPPQLLAYDLIVQDPQTGSLTVTRHVIQQEFGTLTPSPSPTATEEPTSPVGGSGSTGS